MRSIGSVKRVHGAPLIAWKKDICDVLKKGVTDALLRWETSTTVREPGSTISGFEVACGQMIVV